MTGYEFLPGMNIKQVIPKRFWPLCYQKIRDAKKGKPVPYFEMMLKRKDGELLYVETGGQAVFKDGEVIGIQKYLLL